MAYVDPETGELVEKGTPGAVKQRARLRYPNVRFLSDVDRGANRKRWLYAKREATALTEDERDALKTEIVTEVVAGLKGLHDELRTEIAADVLSRVEERLPKTTTTTDPAPKTTAQSDSDASAGSDTDKTSTDSESDDEQDSDATAAPPDQLSDADADEIVAAITAGTGSGVSTDA